MDPTFGNIHRIFDILFNVNANNNYDFPEKNSFDKLFMLLLEIKDFSALIYNKRFIVQPIKRKQGVYEKLVEMSRNNDYTNGNLLDYSFHQNFVN